MIVKKVFNISTKPIQQKPPYVKPKHKTYRQLLQLDKPKMIIHNDSDDQNDDFLQKLMRKQQKLQQQARKKIKQKKLTSAASRSKNKSSKQRSQCQSVKKSQPVQRVDEQIIISSQLKKNQPQQVMNKREKNYLAKIDENNIQNLIKNIQRHYNHKKQNYTSQCNTPIIQSNLQPIIFQNNTTKIKDNNTIVIKKKQKQRSSSTKNLWQDLQLNSLRKSNSYKKRNQLLLNGRMTMPNVIRLAVGDEGRQVVRNQFVCSIGGRKSQGYRVLREQIGGGGRMSLGGNHSNNISNNNNLNKNTLIQTKLNPQLKQVHHQLSTLRKKQFINHQNYSKPTQFLLKNVSSPPIEQLLMNKIKVQNNTQKKIRFKQKLFKSKYQQELFLKSLMRVK